MTQSTTQDNDLNLPMRTALTSYQSNQKQPCPLTYGWNGGHNFSQFEFVQYCGFAGSIQPHCKTARIHDENNVS